MSNPCTRCGGAKIIDQSGLVLGITPATIELPRDCDNGKAETRALAEPAVQRALDGKSPRKVIVVKNRIVNVVA